MLRIAIIFLISALSFTYAKDKVAVLDIEFEGVQSLEAIQTINERVHRAFEVNEGLNVLSPMERDDVFLRKNYFVPKACDNVCLAKAGDLLNVDQIILPQLSKIDNMMSLKFVLFDVNTKQPINDAEVYIDGGISKAILQLSSVIFQAEKQGSNDWVYVTGGIALGGLMVYALFLGGSDSEPLPPYMDETHVIGGLDY